MGVGVIYPAQALLRHEADELRIAQRRTANASVVDLAETIGGTMKKGIQQAAQHEKGLVKYWLVFSR